MSRLNLPMEPWRIWKNCARIFSRQSRIHHKGSELRIVQGIKMSNVTDEGKQCWTRSRTPFKLWLTSEVEWLLQIDTLWWSETGTDSVRASERIGRYRGGKYSCRDRSRYVPKEERSLEQRTTHAQGSTEQTRINGLFWVRKQRLKQKLFKISRMQ